MKPVLDYIENKCIDYFEAGDYVFVHGWIPVVSDQPHKSFPLYGWRNATKEQWEDARWLNGMAEWHHGGGVEGKTIVCGHWHTSWGHHYIDKKCSEFDDDADFSPFVHDGIIALDGCTAYTKKVNCIVIDTDE